jgi:hypothetical protein
MYFLHKIVHINSNWKNKQIALAESAILMYVLWLMLQMDHFVSRFLYFTTAGVMCCMAAVKSCPVLHFSNVIVFWFSGSLMPALIVLRIEFRPSRCYEAWGMLHLFITLQVQTQSNRDCHSYVILLWLMFPRNHFVSRFVNKWHKPETIIIQYDVIYRYCILTSKRSRTMSMNWTTLCRSNA